MLPFVKRNIHCLHAVKISVFSLMCEDIDVVIVTILSANHFKALLVREGVVSANIVVANFEVIEGDFLEELPKLITFFPEINMKKKIYYSHR